jgi:SPP1 gp7 family putative phage head morphogenesis protein
MHALNQGQIETYRSNGYAKLRWVATMDDKTSDICRKRNGKEYSIDNLPDIPAHPNCRCTLVPVISQATIDKAAGELQAVLTKK